MPSYPRIITVDPTGNIARVVNSVMDLLDRAVSVLDLPTGAEALEEVKRGGVTLVISAVELTKDMKGIELALRVAKDVPELPVIILADVDDPDFDEETLDMSPYVYMKRPLDLAQFTRVLLAALEGNNAKEALAAPVGAVVETSFGPVPVLDVNAAQGIVDSLLTDLGAMAIVLSNRAGEVLLGRGAVGYINSEKLVRALVTTTRLNIEVNEMVGGQASSLQYFDGDSYDVFVLSVGLHHFLSIVFDGQIGGRQFGAVNRFGRRAAEDMIALLGANAFIIQPAEQVVKTHVPAKERAKKVDSVPDFEPDVVTLAKADFGAAGKKEEVPAEPEKLFEPIENLDVDKLFASAGKLDLSAADDLFGEEALSKAAEDKPGKKAGGLSWEEAQQLGLLGGGGG